MNTATQTCLTSLTLGAPQVHRNIVVFPLVSPPKADCSWLTLGDALQAGTLHVTETSQSGSVPQLLVINLGHRPVLLLDGEELIGAKQNRVLNTSILLKENSETVVPVSCTEAGRWSYASAKFADASVVMSSKVRARKSSSVSDSLAADASYTSNQGEVWQGIAALHASAGTSSPTGAMHDVFKAREHELQQCLDTFTVGPGQTGLIVIVNGDVAGFDVIPHASLYAREHTKLIKSYVIDALTERAPKPADPAAAEARAREFLRAVTGSDEQRFPSVGYGTDYRYRSTKSAETASVAQRLIVAGSALVHEEQVVHTAFFNLSADPQPDSQRMASLYARRCRFTPSAPSTPEPPPQPPASGKTRKPKTPRPDGTNPSQG